MVTQPGAKNPNWGGGIAVSSHGYLLTKVPPGHPLANRNGYAYTHRIEAEKKIGRALIPGEKVRFRDGNKSNCAHDNLIVVAKQTDEERRRIKIEKATIRKRGVPPVPFDVRADLLGLFDGLCAYCGAKASALDHVDPVAAGGKTIAGNILPACAKCNGSKHSRNVYEWLDATGRVPRVETLEWLAHQQHFDPAEP